MRFDPALKPFLLALKSNYTVWGDRRWVIRLKSHYSLRIYQIIKYNEGLANVDGRKSTIIDLKWFRDFLSIEDGKYILYGHLKSRVIMPAKKDIKKKTDVEFDFIGLRSGRKIDRIEFTWKKNKRCKQLELPVYDDKSKNVKLEEILIYEFGIAKKKAKNLIVLYDDKHIINALEVVREYINTLREKGDNNFNVGGIARKAIEEGWKKQEASINIEWHKQQKKIEEDKKEKKLEEDKKEEEHCEILSNTFDSFMKLKMSEQNKVLKKFRKELENDGNMVIIKRYDNEGISSVVLKSLFKNFLLSQDLLLNNNI
jgi:hypothetical protein